MAADNAQAVRSKLTKAVDRPLTLDERNFALAALDGLLAELDQARQDVAATSTANAALEAELDQAKRALAWIETHAACTRPSRALDGLIAVEGRARAALAALSPEQTEPGQEVLDLGDAA